MKSIEQLDRWIGGVVKRWSHKVSGAPPSNEILEIRRDILTEIKDKIQPRGGGEYIFPYNDVSIRIPAADPARREVAEAAFAEGRSLERDVGDLLSEAGCRLASDFTVNLTITAEESERPFDISFHRNKSVAQVEAVRPMAKLTVVRGATDTPEVPIVAGRVNLGRLKEVAGEQGGLRRRNDVAFSETETTVSREHAYIRFDTAVGKFRVYDYMSQRGTSVFRDGRRIEVPRASTRGVQLQSGDEIHLGDARVRFEILPDNI